MRALGIDWGERHVGVAIGDPTGLIATALEVIHRKDTDTLVKRLLEIVNERGVDTIVVGMPINMDGSTGFMAEKVEAEILILEERLGISIVRADERLSTDFSYRALADFNLSMTKKSKIKDMLSAQFILQGYLDRVRSGTQKSQKQL